MNLLLDQKQKAIREMQNVIDNLKAKLHDQDAMRESLQFSIKSGNERVDSFKNKVISENTEMLQWQKKVDEMAL